jgi:hypothetical protein
MLYGQEGFAIQGAIFEVNQHMGTADPVTAAVRPSFVRFVRFVVKRRGAEVLARASGPRSGRARHLSAIPRTIA